MIAAIWSWCRRKHLAVYRYSAIVWLNSVYKRNHCFRNSVPKTKTNACDCNSLCRGVCKFIRHIVLLFLILSLLLLILIFICNDECVCVCVLCTISTTPFLRLSNPIRLHVQTAGTHKEIWVAIVVFFHYLSECDPLNN